MSTHKQPTRQTAHPVKLTAHSGSIDRCSFNPHQPLMNLQTPAPTSTVLLPRSHRLEDAQLQPLLIRLRREMSDKRLQLRDFFRALDGKRKGQMPAHRFEEALVAAGMKVSGAEMELLHASFSTGIGDHTTCYTRFLNCVEAGNTLLYSSSSQAPVPEQNSEWTQMTPHRRPVHNGHRWQAGGVEERREGHRDR